jgi:hypothetical protein
MYFRPIEPSKTAGPLGSDQLLDRPVPWTRGWRMDEDDIARQVPWGHEAWVAATRCAVRALDRASVRATKQVRAVLNGFTRDLVSAVAKRLRAG